MKRAESAPADSAGASWLALTPAGALMAFNQARPSLDQACLQGILAAPRLPLVKDWIEQGPEQAGLYSVALANGWLHEVRRELQAPEVQLDSFLPHIIGGLSGERRAALASGGGFCVGQAGYSRDQAEALCVAAADFTEFARRQRVRGWAGASALVSFHEDAAMILPSVSFVPFWVDGVDYCLVLAGEPLINNPAFVELLWGIKSAGSRFASRVSGVSGVSE
jgi:hypothetical protein